MSAGDDIQVLSVRLERGDRSVPWGFNVQGGKEFGSPLVILKCNPGSLAERSSLRQGDFILKIGSTSTQHLTHNQARDSIIGQGDNLEMTLQRGAPPRPEDYAQKYDFPQPRLMSTGSAAPGPSTSSPAPGTGFEIASPVKLSPQVGLQLGNKKALLTQSYNSPMGLYSNANIADTLAHTVNKGAGGGAHQPNQYQYQNQQQQQQQQQQQPAAGALNYNQYLQSQQVPAAPPAHVQYQQPPPSHYHSRQQQPMQFQPQPPSHHQPQAQQQQQLPPRPQPQPQLQHQLQQQQQQQQQQQFQQQAPRPTFQAQPPPQPFSPSSTSAPYRSQNLSSNFNVQGSAGSNFSGGRRTIQRGKQGSAITMPAAQGASIPTCAACGVLVRGPFISAMGKVWCPNHFVCAHTECGCSLVDVNFVEENGQLYCEKDFEKYFAPQCAKCNQTIMGECVYALEKAFHPECFVCGHCGKPIGTGKFHMEDGKPYCPKDYAALFSTKCTGCEFAIEAGDQFVDFLESKYHVDCFICTKCNVPLQQNGGFATKNSKPYCRKHAR